MALPTLASVAELASWLNVPIQDGDARAVLVLESASGLARSAAGQTWVDGNQNLDGVPDGVRAIVLTAAARAWHNPTGASQSSTGPFQASYPSGVHLTDDERDALASYRTSAAGGLWTISTTRGDMETKLVRRDHIIDAPGGAIVVTEVEDY
jgi:hypothetical protein